MSYMDLPVVPSLNHFDEDKNTVLCSYVSELAKVDTVQDLKAFVSRWKHLYELQNRLESKEPGRETKRFRMSVNSEKRVLSGVFDYDKALECIKKSKTTACDHAKNYSCEGANIAIPSIFLRMSLNASRFKVSTDLVLIQMFGGLKVMGAWQVEPNWTLTIQS